MQTSTFCLKDFTTCCQEEVPMVNCNKDISKQFYKRSYSNDYWIKVIDQLVKKKVHIFFMIYPDINMS